MRPKPVSGGFTLIELLVVIAVLALLAAVLFPVFARVREKGYQTACLSNMKQLGAAMEIYLDNADETYPPSITFDLPNHIPLDPMLPYWQKALQPLVKTPEVFRCPGNPYAWEWHRYADRKDSLVSHVYPDLPVSYALNGDFFWADFLRLETPPNNPRFIRYGADVKEPSHLIVLTETRRDGGLVTLESLEHPLESALSNRSRQLEEIGLNPSGGVLHTHLSGGCNWLYADGHARWKRVRATVTPKNEWGYPADQRFVDDYMVNRLLPEYR